MTNQFKEKIKTEFSFLTQSKILIAISGGADSVALTHLCHQLNLNFSLAHCNFKLRDKESDADDLFVKQLAKSLNTKIHAIQFNTLEYSKTNKLSTQMAARKLRYDWFNELSAQYQYDYILTGHHADDNLETFFINLTRGTGLDGLLGIPQNNNNIVRPLLSFSRIEILNFLNCNSLKYREDSSNSSTKYLRNKIRIELIPILKQISPNILESINTTQKHLNTSSQLVNDFIETKNKYIITSKTATHTEYCVDNIKKLNTVQAYLYAAFKNFGFTQWDDIYHLLDAQTGKFVLSKTHRLLKNRNTLILSKLNNDAPKTSNVIINAFDTPISTPLGVLNFDVISDKSIASTNANCIFLDLEKLDLPLTVSKWEHGDFFFPIGMQGKKKLSKYMKDEKLSLIDKANVLVLKSQSDIVWVIGKRMDNRYKIDDNTKQILKITLKP